MTSKYITNVGEFSHAIVVDAVAGTRESRTLEFKGRYGKDQAVEVRKDILSLANTRGGALVVGVNESSDKGYRRATSLADPEVEKTMGWISNTLKTGVHPTPVCAYVPLLIAHDGSSTEILVVNVEPYPAAIGAFSILKAEADSRYQQEALLYPVRDDFGVRFLRADEVATEMTAAHTRRIAIAVEELASNNQKVFVSSPIYLARRESSTQYKHRLRSEHGIASLPSPSNEHPDVPRGVVETLSDEMHVYVHAIESRQITLGLGSQLLAVPFGVIREVWRHPDGPLGLLLDCDIVVPQGEGKRAALRSR